MPLDLMLGRRLPRPALFGLAPHTHIAPRYRVVLPHCSYTRYKPEGDTGVIAMICVGVRCSSIRPSPWGVGPHGGADLRPRRAVCGAVVATRSAMS